MAVDITMQLPYDVKYRELGKEHVMDLYRIILVDDEEEVRKSIIKKIDWEDAGFKVVGDAENGQEAMEIIEALEPDVVLTDVRMPYMDGLTLAEWIRQNYPSIKVIIFSGYDDFEYAKQAIRLNVIEYILKPVNVEELTAILKKIKNSLDEEIAQKRNVDLLRKNYLKSLPIIREQFLNDMLHRPIPEKVIDEKLKDYGVDILGAKKWVIAVVEVEKGEIGKDEQSVLHREQELIPISVRQLIGEMLKGYCRIALFTSPIEQVLIAAIDEGGTQTRLITVLGDVCKETKRVLEVPITVGIGHSCSSLTDVGYSYRSAVNALGYKAIVGTGGTIYINDVEPMDPGRLVWDGRDEEALFTAIKFGPKEKIRQAVDGILKRMEQAKVHFNQYQIFMRSVVNSMMQMIQQYDLGPTEFSVMEDPYLGMLWSSVLKQEDFGGWLLKTGLFVNQAMNRERESSMKHLMQEAERYIRENYQDPELSVEKLCRHLHMSPAYFSTMFKKETGQAYTAYLTQVRMEKAVELLEKTDDKTYVIAAKVGYQEQNYFSYVFKKRFGVSPSKYRGAK